MVAVEAERARLGVEPEPAVGTDSHSPGRAPGIGLQSVKEAAQSVEPWQLGCTPEPRRYEIGYGRHFAEEE